jgi:hypothetical protein
MLNCNLVHFWHHYFRDQSKWNKASNKHTNLKIDVVYNEVFLFIIFFFLNTWKAKFSAFQIIIFKKEINELYSSKWTKNPLYIELFFLFLRNVKY